jgi:hypothetical protein
MVFRAGAGREVSRGYSLFEKLLLTDSRAVTQGKKNGMNHGIAAFFVIFGGTGALDLAGTIGIFYKNRYRLSAGMFPRWTRIALY